MTDNIYVIDTSTIIELFKNHPIDIYQQFWNTLNSRFDGLLREGKLIILNYVKDEVIHTVGKISDGSDDPAVMWIKNRNKYIVNLEDDISVYKEVKNILELFPESAQIDKLPPDADPFLIAYIFVQKNQMRITENDFKYVIVTQEHENKKIDLEKIKKKMKPITEITKIPSICKYYGIKSMDYCEMFRYEKWTF